MTAITDHRSPITDRRSPIADRSERTLPCDAVITPGNLHGTFGT
ncbi:MULTISPECIES: hypothetical protein [Xanthomonas]|nr:MULTISPECIES: hypothetical protein [unclassified Xanthomonas]WNH45460.1 hypothetical protein PG878_03050 [Xanthomonas sp. A6251]